MFSPQMEAFPESAKKALCDANKARTAPEITPKLNDNPMEGANAIRMDGANAIRTRDKDASVGHYAATFRPDAVR